MASTKRGYSRDHHWAERTPAGVRVGLSEYAQKELGEITFVQLPEIGVQVARGDPVCAIDALKAASELYAPVGGTVVAVNERLRMPEACQLINDDAEGAGWIFEIAMTADEEFEDLLDTEDYLNLITPVEGNGGCG